MSPATGGPGTAPAPAPHCPVMIDAVLQHMAPRDGGVYADATFGAGGYSRAILQAAECTVIAIDRDPQARRIGDLLSHEFGARFTLLEGTFGDLERLLAAEGIAGLDGIAFDLGLSSMQIDQAGRGFSFQADGPLDMRMSRHGDSAADLINAASEETLIRVLREYGEERRARAIARAIVARRQTAPLATTGELAALVRDTIGPQGYSKINPATRTFQAIRIWVNDELGEIRRGLAAAERVLLPGGRLCVVAFHSLEDRIVKAFLRQRSGDVPRPSRHQPLPVVDPASRLAPTFSLPRRKTLRPKAPEVAANPRARSARLRVAIRGTAPAWPAKAGA